MFEANFPITVFDKINWRLLLFAVPGRLLLFLGHFLLFAVAENKLKGAFRIRRNCLLVLIGTF